MDVRVDLVKRTVTNTGDAEVVLVELIERTTVLAPGDVLALDPNTKVLQI